jgi:hypothetical protein
MPCKLYSYENTEEQRIVLFLSIDAEKTFDEHPQRKLHVQKSPLILT